MTRNATTFSEGITVAMPAYNEEGALADTAARALAAAARATTGAVELLIVDDGSSDGTGRAAAELAAADARVRVHTHKRNMGFAAAQRACYRFASLEWVFLLPADGQVDPEALLDFIPLCGENDLVLGVTKGVSEPGFRGINSAAFHAVARALFDLPAKDFGACLMARRALADSFKYISTTPVAMTELVVRAKAAGANVGCVDVVKRERTHGRAKGGRMLASAPRIMFELAALFVDVKFNKR